MGVMWGGNQTLDQRFQPSELILGVRGSILEWDTLVFLLCALAVRVGSSVFAFWGFRGCEKVEHSGAKVTQGRR